MLSRSDPRSLLVGLAVGTAFAGCSYATGDPADDATPLSESFGDGLVFESFREHGFAVSEDGTLATVATDPSSRCPVMIVRSTEDARSVPLCDYVYITDLAWSGRSDLLAWAYVGEERSDLAVLTVESDAVELDHTVEVEGITEPGLSVEGDNAVAAIVTPDMRYTVVEFDLRRRSSNVLALDGAGLPVFVDESLVFVRANAVFLRLPSGEELHLMDGLPSPLIVFDVAAAGNSIVVLGTIRGVEGRSLWLAREAGQPFEVVADGGGLDAIAVQSSGGGLFGFTTDFDDQEVLRTSVRAVPLPA